MIKTKNPRRRPWNFSYPYPDPGAIPYLIGDVGLPLTLSSHRDSNALVTALSKPPEPLSTKGSDTAQSSCFSAVLYRRGPSLVVFKIVLASREPHLSSPLPIMAAADFDKIIREGTHRIRLSSSTSSVHSLTFVHDQAASVRRTRSLRVRSSPRIAARARPRHSDPQLLVPH